MTYKNMPNKQRLCASWWRKWLVKCTSLRIYKVYRKWKLKWTQDKRENAKSVILDLWMLARVFTQKKSLERWQVLEDSSRILIISVIRKRSYLQFLSKLFLFFHLKSMGFKNFPFTGNINSMTFLALFSCIRSFWLTATLYLYHPKVGECRCLYI